MKLIDSSTQCLFNCPRLFVKPFSKKRPCGWIGSLATIFITIFYYSFIEDASVPVGDFKTTNLTAEINFPFSANRARGLRCYGANGILRLWHTVSYVLNRQIDC
ncbi:hypothetical protein ACFX1T_020255 [Malus domestica]